MARELHAREQLGCRTIAFGRLRLTHTRQLVERALGRSLSALVEDIPEIAELDLNRVFVRPRGVVVADVRLRLTR
jgi:ATP-grasp domain